MGGGMLKLEPRESSRVLLPVLPNASDVAAPFDEIARKRGYGTVQEEVDALITKTVGISKIDLARLKSAAATLRERRTKR